MGMHEKRRVCLFTSCSEERTAEWGVVMPLVNGDGPVNAPGCSSAMLLAYLPRQAGVVWKVGVGGTWGVELW